MAYTVPVLTDEENARFGFLTDEYIRIDSAMRKGVAPKHMARGEVMLLEIDREQNAIIATARKREAETKKTPPKWE